MERDEKLRAIKDNIIRRGQRNDFYGRIAQMMQKNDDLIRLLLRAQEPQYANLLFVIVHYMLLRGAQHPLRHYYATIVDQPRNPVDIYPHFYDFCLLHAQEIEELAARSWVQINYVRRATSLIPAFGLIAQRQGSAPFALLDLGSSAGFLLWWDRFRYDYGYCQLGHPDAKLDLQCDVEGELHPPIPAQMPQVAARLGMDIAPINLESESERLWLLANTSPNLMGQFHEQQHALEIMRQQPSLISQGDARYDIEAFASRLPSDAPLVVVDTYLPESVHQAAQLQSSRLARSRTVFHVSIGVYEHTVTMKWIDYSAEQPVETVLAYPHPLGVRLRWADEATAAGSRKTAEEMS